MLSRTFTSPASSPDHTKPCTSPISGSYTLSPMSPYQVSTTRTATHPCPKDSASRRVCSHSHDETGFDLTSKNASGYLQEGQYRKRSMSTCRTLSTVLATLVSLVTLRCPVRSAFLRVPGLGNWDVRVEVLEAGSPYARPSPMQPTLPATGIMFKHPPVILAAQEIRETELETLRAVPDNPPFARGDVIPVTEPPVQGCHPLAGTCPAICSR